MGIERGNYEKEKSNSNSNHFNRNNDINSWRMRFEGKESRYI